MKTWDPVLLKLARISPPGYGLVIRARNEELLRQLRLLQPSADAGTWVPDAVKEQLERTGFGCPHCLGPNTRCHYCLWMSAGAPVAVNVPCAIVPFPCGIRLCDMWGFATVEVVYDKPEEHVSVKTIVDPGELKACIDFVQDHIDWTLLPEWGADYCEPAAEAAEKETV